jgi:serine/threonine protein kinase
VSIGAHDTFFWSGAVEPPRDPNEIGHIEGWTLLRQVGSGGMGVVFESRIADTGARVAIKLLRTELVKDPHSVHRFLVEANHMHLMSHPHILPVTHVLERVAGPCYVSPYVTGGALSDRLRPGEFLKTEMTLRVSREIASALVYAHGQGIIHRDLKPANVLLDDEDASYLCDFGLVRTVFNDSTSEIGRSQREGTAAYMSPAVAAGQAEDTRCDIYSFGAMLYEMLAGGPPYEGRGSEEIIRKVLQGPPQSISQRNSRAPAGLVKVAEGCMARMLRDRYAQMADVLADLDRIAAGQAPIGPHGGGAGVRWGRLLTAAAACLAVAGLLAAWKSYSENRKPNNTVDAIHNAPTPAATMPTSVSRTAHKAPHVTTAPSHLSPIAERIQEMVRNGTELTLDGMPLADADLEPLDGATEILVLSLSDTHITDAGLVHLKNLSSLAELRLARTAVTGSGFDQLRGLQHLVHLHLGYCPIENGSLAHLQKLSSLRYLNLAGTRVTDAGMQFLGQMPQLREIDLPGPAITDAGLEQLQSLNLDIFGLRDSSVTDAGLYFLRNMTRLTWLDLQQTHVHGHGLVELHHLSRLRTLRLSATPFDETARADLAGFLGLRELTLQNTPISDNDLDAIAPLHHLEQLLLGGTNVTNEGLQSISGLTELSTLDLTGTKVTDAGLRSLQGLKKLADLRLSNTVITDDGVSELVGLSELRQLNLANTHVTDAGINLLQAALPAIKIRR